MDSLLFSVIVPVFNREKLLVRALESLRGQLFNNFEVIVIDDCSTEDIKSVCDNFKKDLNIRYFRNIKNSGGSFSRNFGILQSQGEYIALLDSDDYFLPSKLSVLQSIIYTQNKPPVIFNSSFIKKTDRVIESLITGSNDYKNFIELIVLGENLLQTSACTFKRSLTKRVMFDDSLARHQDLDFYVKLSGFYKDTVFITDLLSVWDISHESPSITKSSSFDNSYEWASNVRSKVGEGAYYNFILKFIYSRTRMLKSKMLLEIVNGIRLHHISVKDFFIFMTYKFYRSIRSIR